MKLAVLGCGAMGSAIITGAIENGYLEGSDITLCDISPQHLKYFAEKYGCKVTNKIVETAGTAEAIILGVKPQHQKQLLDDICRKISHRPLIISIAAGKTIQNIADRLPDKTPIIRTMPNVNALVGASMTALASNEYVSKTQQQWAQGLFDAIGSTTIITEPLFSTYSAIAGCSPAWIYRFADALAQTAVAQGMTKQQASEIIAQALYGSGKNLKQQLKDGKNIQHLIDQVCSPAGTTVAGLLAMEDQGFSTAARAAVTAAYKRDQDISGE